MKLQLLPKSASNHKQLYAFHLSAEELKIMRELLNNAIIHTPRVIATEQLLNRCRNMRRELDKILDALVCDI